MRAQPIYGQKVQRAFDDNTQTTTTKSQLNTCRLGRLRMRVSISSPARPAIALEGEETGVVAIGEFFSDSERTEWISRH